MLPLKMVSIQMAFRDEQRGNEDIDGFVVNSKQGQQSRPIRRADPLCVLFEWIISKQNMDSLEFPEFIMSDLALVVP